MVNGQIGGLFDNVKTVAASDSLFFSDNRNGDFHGLYVNGSSFNEIQRIKAFFKGSVRIKTYSRLNLSGYGTMYIRFDLVRNGTIIKSSSIFTNNTTTQTEISYDMSNIQHGDDIVMMGYSGNSASAYWGRVMPMALGGDIS